MKKIFLLTGMILATNVANAQTEFYTSVKMGFGGTTIYVDGGDKLGDYLVKESGPGYKYSDTGLLWEASTALGIDWSPRKMYVKQGSNEWFHLRLEGEFGYNNYRKNGELTYNYVITDNIKIKSNNFFALINGYTDFRIDNIIPYLGLGIGYSFGNEKIKLSNEGGSFSDSVDADGIIYALHLGVGYKYSDITTFDLGGRRVYAPAKDDGMVVFDTVRFGVRFRI